MSSLFGTLSIAVSGLMAEQGALNVTSNNVANANTPGYSRQRPVMLEGDPVPVGPLLFGSGVVLNGVESVRDPILELRLNEETQQHSQLDTMVSAMQQIEVMFSGSTADIGSQITNFFSSLQQLSTNPANLSARQGVLTAAGNLATAFRSTVNNLESQRSNLDLSVGQTVDQINLLTGQIAILNQQISGIENLHQDAGTFTDQRTQLIRQLSELVDVSVVKSDNTLTITTSSGNALVAGNKSFALNTQTDFSGVQHVFSQGIDITAKLAGGSLAGILQVRDQTIPTLRSDLDTLAAGLATAFNTAHRQGTDLTGVAGGDLFSPPPAGGVDAAAGLSVLITDPSKIAASSDGSPGSNGNLVHLLDVEKQAVAAGQSPTDFYAGIVFRVGSDVANASAERDASDLILRQLGDQRSALSGVSMDEEAANLIRYERAYQAAAHVITVVNNMTDTAIQLGRY
jgi:flagellar hook-associated protein 1 FlgK